MEQMMRRRVPAGLRRLLTGLTDRDWVELEPEPVTGLSLQTSSETLLSPAGSDATTHRPCGLCLFKPSCYTCPRCNVPYCGLGCYRGPAHSACSEEFYKECVSEELKRCGETDDEGRVRMQDILLRLRSSGVENVLKGLEEEESDRGVREQDIEALELLTRLAELQASGNEEQLEEAGEILHEMKKLEEGGDAEEKDEEEDLAWKLSGVDIDSLTEEELWGLLPSRDKKRFEELVKGGGIAGLVPLWRPWWERHERNTRAFIEELRSEEDEEQVSEQDVGKTGERFGRETQTDPPQADQRPPQVKQKKSLKTRGALNSAPPIDTNIPPLHQISASPSPLVQFSVVNTLYGYAFALCQFNGDISESEQLLDFCRSVWEVSESLGASRVFSSLPEALEGAALAISKSGHCNTDDPDAPIRALEAVAHILTGQSEGDPAGYSLSALSHLRVVLSKARASVSKEEEQWRRRFFLAGKKCHFFQSWVKENPEAVRSSARWAWLEHGRKRAERETVEREKKGLEEGCRTGGGGQGWRTGGGGQGWRTGGGGQGWRIGGGGQGWRTGGGGQGWRIGGGKTLIKEI